eukprot:67501-Chlamydomonas_euryale.AAC.1
MAPGRGPVIRVIHRWPAESREVCASDGRTINERGAPRAARADAEYKATSRSATTTYAEDGPCEVGPT